MKLFIDLETSGLDPLIHGIMSIGAVVTDMDDKVVIRKYWKIKLDERYQRDPVALKVNGLDPDTGMELKEALCEFINLCRNIGKSVILITCNGKFDLAFLQAVIPNVNLVLPRYQIDLQSVFVCLSQLGLYDGKVNLDAIAALHGCARSGDKHDALEDCMLMVQIFSEMKKLRLYYPVTKPCGAKLALKVVEV